MFAFLINILEVVFYYLIIIRATHYHIIIVIRTTLHGFIVGNTKGSIMSTRKYLIIKRTLILFKKKFTIAGSKKRH